MKEIIDNRDLLKVKISALQKTRVEKTNQKLGEYICKRCM